MLGGGQHLLPQARQSHPGGSKGSRGPPRAWLAVLAVPAAGDPWHGTHVRLRRPCPHSAGVQTEALCSGTFTSQAEPRTQAGRYGLQPRLPRVGLPLARGSWAVSRSWEPDSPPGGWGQPPPKSPRRDSPSS